jgi:hypothetical protein
MLNYENARIIPFKKEMGVFFEAEKTQSYLGGHLYEFVVECLKKAPDYFFTIPASASGKHHPTWACTEGGLIRHTKTAIALFLESAEAFKLEIEDVVEGVAALILHDSIKYGLTGPGEKEENHFNLNAHAIAPRYYYKDIIKEYSDWKSEIGRVFNLIESHMGVWSASPTLEPVGNLAMAVHLADYNASRWFCRCLELENFQWEPRKVEVVEVIEVG